MSGRTVRRSVLQMRILMTLSNEQGLTVTAIGTRVGASRPSVSRSIHALAAEGVVKSTDSGWHLTSAGARESEIYSDRLIEMAEQAAKAVMQLAPLVPPASLNVAQSVLDTICPTLTAIEESKRHVKAVVGSGLPQGLGGLEGTTAGVLSPERLGDIMGTTAAARKLTNNLTDALSEPTRKAVQDVASFAGVHNKVLADLRASTASLTADVARFAPLRVFDFAALLPRADYAKQIFLATDQFRKTIATYDFADLFDKYREIIDADNELIQAFQAAGWPIAPSMSRSVRAQVLAAHRDGNKRNASLVIMGFYRRDECARLASAVERWRALPYFDARMHIIDDALSAHRDRKFTLSVPALMPLIEGVLVEWVYDNDPEPEHALKRDHTGGHHHKLPQVFVGDPDDYGLLVRGMAVTLLAVVRDNTFGGFSIPDEVRKRAPHRRQPGRHGVTHGLATAYDKESISLRAFLLLDATSALIQIKQRDEEAA